MIKLPCIFYTPEAIEMMESGEKMGIRYEDEDLPCEIRDVTFYSVDAVYQDAAREETVIWSGGNAYYTKVDIDQVNEAL